jgi:hypothetical protein
MIENRYLLMIGIVICVLVLYYFYDEITSTKKIVIPSYQKTMQLEAKLLELEKKTNEFISKNSTRSPKQRKKILDSPALSITYQSDMLNKNNTSIVYEDFSETEAKKIRQKLELVKQNSNKVPPSPRKSDSDIFGFRNSQKEETPTGSLVSPKSNYQDILNNLSTEVSIIASEEKSLYSSIFDSEVAKCISDSVNCVDLGQTNMSEISEIPLTSITNEPLNKKINRTLIHKKVNKSYK